MSFIEEAEFPFGVDEGVVELIKGALHDQFWQWFKQHQDDVVLKKNLLFFSLTVRVRDLRFVFNLVFGAE